MSYSLITGKQIKFFLCQLCGLQCFIIQRNDLVNSKIMERTKKILLHCLLQTDFMCNLIMEDFIDIFPVLIIIPFIRSRCHPQKQSRFEILNNLSVNVVRTVMRLIKDNTIKIIWLILK